MPFILQELIHHSQSLSQTKQLHALSIALNLITTAPSISSSLIISYSSFNSPSTSLLLFHSLPPLTHNASLYNSLIRALSLSNLHRHSLLAYNSLISQFPSLRPNHRTFSSALPSCASFFLKGAELHASILKLGFLSDTSVSNNLLSFYSSSSLPHSAHQVFTQMPHPDLVSWNSLISAFSLNSSFLHHSMHLLTFLLRTSPHLRINPITLLSVLPSCATARCKPFGMCVHGLALKLGLIDSHTKVANAFLHMYGMCGDAEASIKAFHAMENKTHASWNSLIGTLVRAGMFEDAVSLFRSMLAKDGEVQPSSVTVACLLPGLVDSGWFAYGKELHVHVIRTGMDSDVFVTNSLIDMYAKNGCMTKASEIFNTMERRNLVSWNAMIANLAQNGSHLEAIGHVLHMQDAGERPSSVTFTNVLPACARLASLKKGREIHALSMRDGSFLDLFVSNALIDMYAKCSRLDLARRVFEVSERDRVSYNALITGYSQSAYCSKAFHLFREMETVGFEHDAVSFMGALSVCANISALKQGKEIHCLTVKKSFDVHLFVANSLLDLYTKTGRIDLAQKLFDRIPNKDVASWNAMISGYGMQGEWETAISLFDLMECAGVECDHVSFVAVLSACSHGGLVERGKNYFEKMLEQNIRPIQMHYACMVDLLGRAGLMEEAVELIKGMTFEADCNVWGALLGACRVHGNIELGQWAADHLFALIPEHSGYHILLSNMYIEVGKYEEANKIRKLVKSRKPKKNPGCSWLQTGDDIHTLIIGEQMEKLVNSNYHTDS